jgi:hypothetical protein
MVREDRDGPLFERDARLSAACMLACEELIAAGDDGEHGQVGWFAPYNFERPMPLDIEALLEAIIETGDRDLLAALVQGAGDCVAALAVWCLLDMSSAVSAFPSKDFMRLSLSSKEENSERRFTALRRVLSPKGEAFSGGADAEQRRKDRHLFSCLIAAAAGKRQLESPPHFLSPLLPQHAAPTP